MGQLHVCGLLVGKQTDGAIELRYGFPGPPERKQARAGEQPGRPERRIEPGRGSKFRQCLRVMLPLLLDDAKVVMDERALPARGQHVPERGLRRIQLPGFESRDTFREAGREGGGEVLRAQGRGDQQ